MTSSGSPEPARNAAGQSTLGVFTGQSDVGAISRPGSWDYDPEQQVYTVTGGGAGSESAQDTFHFVWKRLRGDFILTARGRVAGAGGTPPRTLGWMVRSSLDAAAANVHNGIHGDGRMALRVRRTPGAPTEEVPVSVTAPDVIQLERKGDAYIMSVARFGEPFVSEQVANVGLGDEVYAGLYAGASNDAGSTPAVFDNVRVVVPAGADAHPYAHTLGSHLEILDVESGRRRIVYSSPEAFEAPNWTRDGQALIFNSKGRLYRFDLATQTPTVIDTGFATRNNNDHLLSPDGTMLGISHHSEEDGGKAIVYVVPVQGGTPRRITHQGPSYLHGWSPDGRFLAYTGQRDGAYGIYTIPVDGGEETQLTTTAGLDDGPEYSPDGHYIYFNSTRSGTMQLWRMRPDGSAQEQLTDDAYNNWFAHLSPDGQVLVFLTYIQDVAPTAHPPNKHVYLRLMPANGGLPRVVAYLYGGQGTINVPSWSPDGRQIAFVSYSGR